MLDSITTAGFIQYVLDHHAPPSTVVVCSTREVFLEELLNATKAARPATGHEEEEQTGEVPVKDAFPIPPQFLLQAPTLRLLSSSRTIRVTFCPDITHLRAMLAVHAARSATQMVEESRHAARMPILAVLNPLQLHEPTSAYSAQGLNRTFATAVEAAHHAGQKLVIAECSTLRSPRMRPESSDGFEEAAGDTEAAPETPWDREVSILNVTTKSFGAGERGWVGRTVRIRKVAERWCTFESLSAD